MNKLRIVVYWGWLALLGISLCSCLKDDSELCDSFIRFRYDYNLLEVDAFHTQATNVELYLYDANGMLVKQVSGEVPQGLDDNTYRLMIPRGLENVTHMVAWAGLNGEHFDIPKMTERSSTMEELKIALKAAASSEINVDFVPLLWGELTLPEGLKYGNHTHVIPMRKNTNSFRVALQSDPGNNFDINVSEFQFLLTSPNGSYDCSNNNYDAIERIYTPHFTENSSSELALGKIGIAEICTLRLMEKDKTNRLQIVHRQSGEKILDIDLNHYLSLLKLVQYSKYSFQEYLDREDHYNFIIFLNRNIVDDQYAYFSTNIRINGWIVREQPVDK